MFKKIVFMGTPNFSVPVLKSLYQNGYPIITVYTQPPKKSMRGQKINKSPIQKLSENLQLNISKAKKKLSWRPRLSILESINFTVEWYKETIVKKKDPYLVTKNQIRKFYRIEF